MSQRSPAYTKLKVKNWKYQETTEMPRWQVFLVENVALSLFTKSLTTFLKHKNQPPAFSYRSGTCRVQTLLLQKLHTTPLMGKGKAPIQPRCPHKEHAKCFYRPARYVKYHEVQISCQSFTLPIQTKSKYFLNKKQTQEL